ncbi:hypothetical protein D3C86_1323680 [compost metagenome]
MPGVVGEVPGHVVEGPGGTLEVPAQALKVLGPHEQRAAGRKTSVGLAQGRARIGQVLQQVPHGDGPVALWRGLPCEEVRVVRVQPRMMGLQEADVLVLEVDPVGLAARQALPFAQEEPPSAAHVQHGLLGRRAVGATQETDSPQDQLPRPEVPGGVAP